RALQGDRDDLHVVVRVRAEALARGDDVVVHHAQHTEVHAGGIVPIGEAEAEVGLQPAVVGGAALAGAVQYHVAHTFGGCWGEVVEAHDPSQPPLRGGGVVGRKFFIYKAGGSATAHQH